MVGEISFEKNISIYSISRTLPTRFSFPLTLTLTHAQMSAIPLFVTIIVCSNSLAKYNLTAIRNCNRFHFCKINHSKRHAEFIVCITAYVFVNSLMHVCVTRQYLQHYSFVEMVFDFYYTWEIHFGDINGINVLIWYLTLWLNAHSMAHGLYRWILGTIDTVVHIVYHVPLRRLLRIFVWSGILRWHMTGKMLWV